MRLNVYIEFIVPLSRASTSMYVFFRHSIVFVNGVRGEFTYDTPRAALSLYIYMHVHVFVRVPQAV